MDENRKLSEEQLTDVAGGTETDNNEVEIRCGNCMARQMAFD